MRFGTFITTFKRPAILATTVEAVLAQSRLPDLLLIVDNGSSPEAAELVRGLGDPRVTYVDPGSNLGSAGGVAFGMQWLYDAGFDWMHSVDDDDPPRTADTIERLQELIGRQDDGRLGAVAAFGSWWNWETGQYRRIPDDALTGDLRVDTVGGNSQLTVRREVITRIGTPEREFFFGFYDPLYCLRLAQAGYHVMVDGDLMHEYRGLVNRLNREITPTRVPADPYHALWRRYYVSRNYIFRMRRTFDRPDLARREARRALLRSLASWGRGPRYGARYSSLQLRGVLDGYRDRLGRTVEPQQKPS
jgi:rhamnopyranosyl-N-acetylglucosaminyl-diphospho-decaprenol beta-1,3/1,4-galactofuranosyltransferase